MTVALMLSEVRGIVRRNLRANGGEWLRRSTTTPATRPLCNLKIGLVGYGGIARTVAKRLIRGFGCEVVAYELITRRPR